jgi:glutamine phosphoribosylpyrophosphate amidotransferase
MPSPKELVAHGRTEPEIAEAIGADLVIYQTLEDLVQSQKSRTSTARSSTENTLLAVLTTDI